MHTEGAGLVNRTNSSSSSEFPSLSLYRISRELRFWRQDLEGFTLRMNRRKGRMGFLEMLPSIFANSIAWSEVDRGCFCIDCSPIVVSEASRSTSARKPNQWLVWPCEESELIFLILLPFPLLSYRDLSGTVQQKWNDFFPCVLAESTSTHLSGCKRIKIGRRLMNASNKSKSNQDFNLFAYTLWYDLYEVHSNMHGNGIDWAGELLPGIFSPLFTPFFEVFFSLTWTWLRKSWKS